MLRTKWSERLLLRKIPMMHIKKRLIELSANHNTKTNVCKLKSFIFPWFTVVTCFHFHVLTTKGSSCLEFWLMVYCRVSTIDLWSHKIIGHLVKMKYCMKVPTYIKKKTNKHKNWFASCYLDITTISASSAENDSEYFTWMVNGDGWGSTHINKRVCLL